MKYYRLINMIFGTTKDYAGRKELQADTQFSNNTIAVMVEDGEARHGYIIDEIEREDYEEERDRQLQELCCGCKCEQGK